MGPNYPKNVEPPPHILGGGEFFWFGLTPPIFLRGVATGLRSGGSPSTVLRGEYNDQGGGQFSNSGGVLWQKSWKKSTPPFQYFRGKVLMVWTVLPLDCSEGGGIFHDFCHITPSELQNYSPLIIVVPLSTEPLLTLIHCPSLIVCNSKLWVPTFSLIFMILREGVPKTPFPENTQFHSPLTVSLLKLIHRVNILSPY